MAFVIAVSNCQQPRPAFKAFFSSHINPHDVGINDMIWTNRIVVCKVQRLGISMVNNWTSSLREILQPLALSAAGQKFTSEENVRQLVHPLLPNCPHPPLCWFARHRTQDTGHRTQDTGHPLLPNCPHLPSAGSQDTEKWEKSWTALLSHFQLLCVASRRRFSLWVTLVNKWL